MGQASRYFPWPGQAFEKNIFETTVHRPPPPVDIITLIRPYQCPSISISVPWRSPSLPQRLHRD